MRTIALLAVMLALGCVSQTQEATTTTATVATTTSSTSTTATTATTTTETSATTTSSTLPAISGCDELNATFWRALCYDDGAYAENDPQLCRTVYCKARFEGESVCGTVDLNMSDWTHIRMKACEAWADRTPFKCREVMKSGDCIRWYAMLEGNMTLCEGAENMQGDCAAEFAYWRGDIGACGKYKTPLRIGACESNYWRMAALDNGDPGFCAGITAPRLTGECRDVANWTGRPEKHPLFGLKEQLIGG
jgi:hypothetical protein